MLPEAAVVDAAVADEALPTVRVEQVMHPDPLTVEVGDSVRDAAACLTASDRKQLPVVSGGEMAGVLTTTDIAAWYPRSREQPVAAGPRTGGPGARGTEYTGRDWAFDDDGEMPERIEVGDTVRFEKTISGDDVAAFAQASGDTNQLHLNDEVAGESRFGRRIAHGALVAGVISATLARLPGTVIYLSQSTDFVAPVDIGERVSAAVTAVESVGQKRWRLDTTVFDSDDETVIEGEAVVLVADAAA